MLKMFICLLALTSSHFCHATSKSFQNVADSASVALLRAKADSLAEAKEIAKSNEIYNRLITIYKEAGENDQLLTVINKISLNYLRIGDHVLAKKIYTQNDYQNIPIKDSLILSSSYYHFGISRHFAGDYREGLEYAEKALAIKLRSNHVDPYELSLNYNLIGVSYNQLGLNDEAISCYQKYLAMIKKLPESDKNNLLIATAYNNLGIIYTEHLADHDRALEYYFKSVDIKKKVLGEGKPILAESYTNIGNVLMLTRPHEALQYIQKSIAIYEVYFPKEHLNVLQAYNSVADCYYELKNYEMALFYLDEVIRIGTAHFGEQHYEVALAYSLKFSVFKAMSDKTSAIKYGEKGLDIYKKYYPEGFEVARAYLKMAEFYSEEKELEKASLYVNEAINHCFVSGKKVDIENIRFENIRDVGILANAIELKAHLQTLFSEDLKVGKPDGESVQVLYDYLINIYSKVLQRYKSEYSNEYIRESLYALLERALLQEKKLGELAYYKVQKSKNIFLKTYVTNATDSNKYSHLPDSLLINEKQIKRQIEIAENKLLQSGFDENELIEQVKDELFALNSRLEEHKSYIRTNFKDYYQLKYQSEAVKLSEIQGYLKNGNQALIEYFVGEKHIYIFATTAVDFTVKRIPNDSLLTKKLDIYRSGLYNPNLIRPIPEEYSEFVEASWQLYDYLIAPVQSLVKGKDLVIIPDGELALIPFEAFLTKAVNQQPVDFKQLPYMIRDFVISYTSSVAMFISKTEREGEDSGFKGNMLAFAPEFKIDPLAYSQADSVRSSLKPLNWTAGEVDRVSRHFDSQVYLAENATERIFREYAETYDIIHIASHGVVSDENPMHSKIAFSVDEEDSINDGYLHTFELYNFRMKAEMMVLSACHTGYGKIIKGEGVMNLARGCFYAGCQSVVMSLWVANDRSTATLMNNFYKHLAEDEPKNLALRNAKLEYLNNHEGISAHPYYWSQFVLSGNTSSISKRDSQQIYYVVVSLFVVVFILGIYLIRRRGKSRTIVKEVDQ